MGRVSESSTTSIGSEREQSSVSSSSSSSSTDPLEKAGTSIQMDTPALSELPAQKPVLPTQSQQVQAKHESFFGERPSTSTECVARNEIPNFGHSNRHNQTYKQKRYLEAQNELHSEFKIGDNNGKAANRHRLKPLQKYVKKTSITFSSASSQVDSVGVPDCSIGSTTSELDQSAVSSSSSSSSSETLVVAKVDNSDKPETSTLPHSSAKKSVAPAHLHQVKAPHEFVLAKKPSTSIERASRNGTFDASTVHHHPAYQQPQYSESQNKLHSCFNMGDNNGKVGYDHKLNQHQVYVKKKDISYASASNERGPVNGVLDNPEGSTSGHTSQSTSAYSSSKSLQSTNVNQSSMLRNPSFSLSSAHKPVITDHMHQEGAPFIFGKKDNTPVQCKAQNGTFVFGVNNGHPTNQQSQSSLLPEQHTTHSVCGHSHSINSHRGSYATPTAGHNGVSSVQTEAWPSGSTVQGLDDICRGISRLNISESSRRTGETRQPFEGAPDPSMGMPYISRHPIDLPEAGSSFYPGSNTSCHLNHCSDPHSGRPPSSSYTCRSAHPPNPSSDMQHPGHSGEKPGYPSNSSEPESTVGHILRALDILKAEKMFPTESNISDCICYGEMNLTGFDVKKALDLAIRHQAVVMKKLLNDMPLFVAKDEILWKCVNLTNSKAKDPKEELDTVHKYISSADGYSAIKNSQSRYQAAVILKKSCLQQYALGDVLQVLHIAIVRKKWLVPHLSGWQPLSLNTTVVIATTDAFGKA